METPPAHKITMVTLTTIGSILMIASAVGTIWTWTTTDVSLGFKIMFPLLTSTLFAVLFQLGMTLLQETLE